MDRIERMGGANRAPLVGNAARVPAPLEVITDRILNAARQMQEIGHKLDEHADRVHGPVPTARGEAVASDRPEAAIERIHAALNELDMAHAYVAEQAGRNCVLA